MDCIFCKIIDGSVKSDTVYETDNFIVIKDIHPAAPIHLLIIPKEHLSHPSELSPEQSHEQFQLAATVAQKLNITENGYRLVYNLGRDANQEISHIHLHLLAGRRLAAMH